jgi:hypothetical protein
MIYNFSSAQPVKDSIYSFTMNGDVRITIDMPAAAKKQNTILILYALPNGNTTGQTMGKKMQPGDDWHYDIQHIRAQTIFLRRIMQGNRIVVAYLENEYKSWPAWKTKHADYMPVVRHIVDTLYQLAGTGNVQLYLNGHSGGGRFIFSYLDGLTEIPSHVKRISFLDSNYGYDSSYLPKFTNWLQKSSNNCLSVFAYNDSVALYEGKPVVSATGGTWYRSHLMMEQLSPEFPFRRLRNDSVIAFASRRGCIRFYFKTNPDRKIFHTTQVERNGFIHSVLCGTRYESKEYVYYGERAYRNLIE